LTKILFPNYYELGLSKS